MTPSILWLGRTLPLPLNSGDRIYSAKLAGAVARAGAQVVFLGLGNPDEPMGDLDSLDPGVRWELVAGKPRPRLLSLFSPLPIVGARFATTSYRKALKRELESREYNAVVFDHYGLDWAVEEVRRFSRTRPALVHLAHDFETDVTAQIAANFSGNPIKKFLLSRNATKTALAEQRLAKKCDIVACLTNHDRAGFVAINPLLLTVILPPGYSGVKQPPRVLGSAVARRTVIVGSFQWIAKQMNLERFMAEASEAFVKHDIELHIIGFVPKDVQSRLSQRFPFAHFRGFVTDLGKEFQCARIALVPEETGGGFKLKTLDYIFNRIPVAAIDSALNGITEELKSNFIIANDLKDLVVQIVQTIDDLDRLNTMQRKAFSISEGLFDWDHNGRQLLNVVETVREQSGAAHLPASKGNRQT